MFLFKDRNCIPCEIYIDSSLIMTELSSDLSNIIKTQIYYRYTIITDILTEESN